MNESQPATPAGARRCFVVMGFGIKTDFATGRKLDLDKSYRLLIKPVVEERKLVCVRADEIRHSGAIDLPMYQELLTADVVIADISTANPNAIYELGIRHALRPWTTIVISENKLAYPFDLNHISISGYTHLGEAIDFEEVMRFRKVLGDTLDAVLSKQNPDSPIYTFLQLVPPSLRTQAVEAVAQAGEALAQAGNAIAAAAHDAAAAPVSQDKTLAAIIDQAEQALQKGAFAEAKMRFELVLQLARSGSDPDSPRRNPYLIQRLVLATYKAPQPDEPSAIKALNEALALLNELGLEESNDPETVGLAGAIEKRLFDKGQGPDHLARAIRYYGRGHFLRNDRYNGINLAYLLNVRTDSPLDPSKEEKIADLVWANRLRREILVLCDKELADIRARDEREVKIPDKLQAYQRARDKEQKFWCLATQAEAYVGLGDSAAYEKTRSEAKAIGLADWMLATMDEQIERLKTLLAKHGHLLGPS